MRLSESLALFAGVMIAGLPVLLPALHLFLRHGAAHALCFYAVVLAAILSSDIAWYLVGRCAAFDKLRNWILRRRGTERFQSLGEAFIRTRGRTLFACRFLYGTKIAVQLLSGYTRLPVPAYLAISLASGIAWVSFLTLLWLACGSAFGTFERSVGGTRMTLAGLALLGFTINLLSRYLGRAGRSRKSSLPHPHAGPAQNPGPGTAIQEISVVIPAASEEAYLGATLRSCREQTHPHIETIVVVNGATDNTPSIAQALADKTIVLEQRCGASMARNLGAEEADGDVLIFLDADSQLSTNAAAEVAAHTGSDTFGTVLGAPDIKRLRYLVFFAAKNLSHRLGLYHGVLGGMMFCHRDLFQQVGGFDSARLVDEHYEFSRRARRTGAAYRLLTRCSAITAMRRFERDGSVAMVWFWARIRARSILNGKQQTPVSDYAPIS